jgi:ABC-2 type transport system permease protein
MPSWLQPVVGANPISRTVTAARGLMHGTVAADQIVWVLLACAVVIAVFAPLTTYLYRTRR